MSCMGSNRTDLIRMPIQTTVLHRALLFSGIAIFTVLLLNGRLSPMSLYQWWFLLTASLATSLLLIAPVWMLERISTAVSPWPRLTGLVISSLYFLLLVLLAADYKLYSLYGFHINGFVVNLVLTPGGIESMGSSQSFYLTIAKVLLAALVLFFSLILFFPIERLLPQTLMGVRFWAGVFMLTFLAQGASYALAAYRYDKSVLGIADRVAFHVPVTAAGFLKKLGVERPPKPVGGEIKLKSGTMHYPLASITIADHAPKPNIVWLVAESWRWDMLDPEIMPHTWKFATEQGMRSLQHYSGGNGTRMGMFSQFYSLYGSYWFDALRARRQPVLFDVLDQQGYTKKGVTSALFSYPEFDQTIFSGFKQNELHSDDKGAGWERDQRNVDVLLDYMQQAQEPYFAFMFFESPHANYHFPPDAVIRPDYLPDFDYATMDLDKDIDRIKNRYINACHQLDKEFARVLAFLQTNDRLANTIVIITGDHGEEFMENGRWGHNSTFVQQQIRVPLILAGAGIKPGVLDRMTSHDDLIPTLLPLLGVTNPASDYGFGQNMQAQDFNRRYSVVSDWHGPVLITPTAKFILAKNLVSNGSSVTNLNDKSLADDAVSSKNRKTLGLFMGEYSRYLQRY